MYRRALVPLDGSPVAETILPFIAGIAGPLDMEVVLFRAVQPIPPMALEGSRLVVMEDVDARRVDAEEYLAPIALELSATGIRVGTKVQRGTPAAEIVAAARDVDADLIAMTTHGRNGLGRLMFGSVAEAVLRHSDTPVFILRATEAQVERRTARAALV